MIKINPNWTLFLDRDGVINHEIVGQYISQPEAFIFYAQAAETISRCDQLFKRVLIVTNQRGIGRGIMSESQLHRVHEKMLRTIQLKGGKIDKIYYAIDVNDDAINRKPNTGMAEQALLDFPDIDFNQSVMVGNNLSDMKFGKRLGMTTVFIKSTQPDIEQHELIDYALKSLADLPSIVSFEDN